MRNIVIAALGLLALCGIQAARAAADDAGQAYTDVRSVDPAKYFLAKAR